MIDRQFFGFVAQLQLKPVGQHGLKHRPDLFLRRHVVARRLGHDLEKQSASPGWCSRDLIFLNAVGLRNECAEGAPQRDPVACDLDSLAGSSHEGEVQLPRRQRLLELLDRGYLKLRGLGRSTCPTDQERGVSQKSRHLMSIKTLYET